jgi:hypothetical protein
MPPKAAKPAVKEPELPPPVARTPFSPQEAKKLTKLLKASDRGKRLDAIATAGADHAYIAQGGCLLPLLESLVPKKKTEDIVKAAADVLVQFLLPLPACNAEALSEPAQTALKEISGKPTVYRAGEILTDLLAYSDPAVVWAALRCLRYDLQSFPEISFKAIKCCHFLSAILKCHCYE